MMNKFKVIDHFKLTKRGFVLVGDLLTGEVSVGDNIQLGAQKYLIKAVEYVDKVGEKVAHLGLILAINDDEIEMIKSNNIKDSVIEIVST